MRFGASLSTMLVRVRSGGPDASQVDLAKDRSDTHILGTTKTHMGMNASATEYKARPNALNGIVLDSCACACALLLPQTVACLPRTM